MVLCFLYSDGVNTRRLSASAECLTLISVLRSAFTMFTQKTIICSDSVEYSIILSIIYNHIPGIPQEMAQFTTCWLQGLIALKTCPHFGESRAF